MQFRRYIFLVAALLLTLSCTNEDFLHDAQSQDGPITVGFWMGGSSSGDTRTAINDDGQTVAWVLTDKVALWAKPENTTDYTFTNQTFDTWFVSADNSQAYFTATLGSEMPEGQYSYYACYPVPQSVSGTTATFTIPATQNGKMGEGADIMVAQGSGPALRRLYTPADPNNSNVKPDYVLKEGLELKMRHLIHALRFYVPQAKWGFPENETVERIVFTMPQNITGTVTADVASATGGLTMTSAGGNTISLNLTKPIGKSGADAQGVVAYDYAAAAIMPATYSGNMTVRAYSQTKAAQHIITINSRDMQAGHITPVGLDCSNVKDRPKISFRIASNNLGEQPYKITLTSSDTSTQWKAGDDHVYEYYTGSESKTVAVGSGFDLYSDDEVISSISGKTVTVTYESKSAIVTETITMPTMSAGNSYSVSLAVPYLFAESFDGFASDDSHWKEKENSGSWINGWSGNQWRTNNSNMGICSYVGSYGSIITDCYHGRLDSPVISSLKIGVNVTLSMSFDVSLNDKANNGNTGCIFGFTTSIDANVGGYTSITALGGTSVRNTPEIVVGDEVTSNGTVARTYTFNQVPEDLRMSWFADINKTSGTITSKWFEVYLDNIKVQIVSE